MNLPSLFRRSCNFLAIWMTMFVACTLFLPQRLYVSVLDMTVTRSTTQWMTLGLCAVVVIFCELFQPDDMDVGSMGLSLLAPVGCMALIDCGDNLPLLMLVILGLGGVFLGFLLVTEIQWLRRPARTQVSQGRRVKKSVFFMLHNLFNVLGVVGLCFVVASALGTNWFHDHLSVTLVDMPEVYARVYYRGEEYDQAWDTMTMEERETLLQYYVDCETDTLGVPTAMRLVVTDLDEGVLGEYNPILGQICVDTTHLAEDPFVDCVDTVVHEMRHCYQYYLCDVYELLPEKYRNLLAVRDASIYLAEFGAYANGDDDFSDYYYQACEQDARDYAAAQMASCYYPEAYAN